MYPPTNPLSDLVRWLAALVRVLERIADQLEERY